MRKLYNSKAFWLVIALLASLSLWIYVISQETEAYKQTFRGVKVELVGEDILLNSRNMVIGNCHRRGIRSAQDRRLLEL